MNKILLEKNGEYTLWVRIKETGTPVSCEPYVVAWKYDEKADCWAQGHYFSSLRNATDYFYGRRNDIIADKLQSMIHHIAYNNCEFTCSCCIDTLEINTYIYRIAKELEELQKFCEEHKVPFEPPYTVVSDTPLTNDKA